MQKELRTLTTGGVRMVAISVDPLAKSEALAADMSLEFPLLADTDRALTKAFGVYDRGNDIAWPAVFVLGPDGVVAWRSFEDSYKERVATEEIVAAVSKVASGRPDPR